MGSRKKVNLKLGEDVLAKMWNGVRENNGIMVSYNVLCYLCCKTKSTCLLHEMNQQSIRL